MDAVAEQEAGGHNNAAATGGHPARRVALHVEIGGHNASDHIKPDLLDFVFTDNASGKADEIQLTLADLEGKWAGAWAPKKGATVKAELRCLHWFGEGMHANLPMGSFVVDEIEESGPPDRLTIKAVSAAKSGSLAKESRTKAWESFTLQGIAGEIAQKHELELMYDAPAHKFQRLDQREESDLAFLHRLCGERGVNLKVHDGKMVLFGEEEWDAKKASVTIPKRGDPFSPKSWRFKLKSEGTYKKAKVAYHDPATRETHTATVTAPEQKDTPPPSGQTLVLNERVESAADAIAAGTAKLRGKNKNEVEGTLEIMGHPGLAAGMTVRITGFGKRDGAYSIKKAEHRVSPAYTTTLELRPTLKYGTSTPVAEEPGEEEKPSVKDTPETEEEGDDAQDS